MRTSPNNSQWQRIDPQHAQRGKYMHTLVNKPFDRLLTVKEVSAIMGRSPKTLWRWWKVEKRFPVPIMSRNRALGWRESQIEHFLSQHSSD